MDENTEFAVLALRDLDTLNQIAPIVPLWIGYGTSCDYKAIELGHRVAGTSEGYVEKDGSPNMHSIMSPQNMVSRRRSRKGVLCAVNRAGVVVQGKCQ